MKSAAGLRTESWNRQRENGRKAMKDREGERLTLEHEWVVGKRIGGGGFGQVFLVNGEAGEAVAKLVPKAPGADRELLFVDLEGVRNIIPILESGEHDDHWVLVMPRAERSLQDHFEAAGDGLELAEVLDILRDVSDALVDLDGKVVHRDLKPHNILLLNDSWCLADFGISRYAEATTAPETQKFALSRPYAAPERWRDERATTATDVYSLGVIAHEMIAGQKPFPGPDFRGQHLHADPPRLDGVPPALAALVQECLYKAPEARPSPANLRARLSAIAPAKTPGLARLQEVNRAEVERQSEAKRNASKALSERERRARLQEAAAQSFAEISGALRNAISEALPSAQSAEGSNGGWRIGIPHKVELRLSGITNHLEGQWGGWDPPAFEVLGSAFLNLRVPPDQFGYEGRSHSLWYGDIQEKGRFEWFETAFMFSALTQRHASQAPFSLDPGERAAKAVWTGMAEIQVAWPFTPLRVGELDELIDRWGGWLADAAEGTLSYPRTMPERGPRGSWRRS